MSAPSAERLRKLRLHHNGCPDMCPDADLLAALDYVAERLQFLLGCPIHGGGGHDCSESPCPVIRDTLTYIGASVPS